LAQPWPLKIVLDYVLESKHMPDWLAKVVRALAGQNPLSILYFAIAAVAIIALVGAISTYSEKYLTTSVGNWVAHDMRRTLYHHIHRLSLSQHDEARTGDLISRVTSDIESIQDFVTSALLGIAVDVLTLAGMIGVMFYLNWRFTLIALSVAPPLFVVVYVYTRKIKKAARDVRKKESELVSTVQEVLSSIRVVQAFTREKYEQKRFETTSLENVEMSLQARAIKARLSPFVDIVVAVGTCLVLWYGARLVLSGQMLPGSLVVFVLYLGNMYKPMRDLSKMTDTISKAVVGYERTREVLETESKIKDSPNAKKAPRFKGLIEFQDVSFSYTPDVPVLNGVNIRIEPNQVVAFVGPTGAGKSTIISLVARFYDPTSGVVKIDGADIRNYKLHSLRKQMSFVLQDTLLFRAPLWQNIAYGKPEASRAEIIKAAELANATEFIDRLPEGYDTMVGERGVTLSGGQRQRIAIARAVLRDSPILLLDEPTSALDASSEQLVVEALSRLMEGKTTIVIAHHLATIQKSDVIFVIKDCAIAEQGTHEELIKKGGVYSELYGLEGSVPEVKPAHAHQI
jgi:subfamily B ATP-binding cassette protein MsbA